MKVEELQCISASSFVIRHSSFNFRRRQVWRGWPCCQHRPHLAHQDLLRERLLQHFQVRLDDPLVADVVFGIAGNEENFHVRPQARSGPRESSGPCISGMTTSVTSKSIRRGMSAAPARSPRRASRRRGRRSPASSRPNTEAAAPLPRPRPPGSFRHCSTRTSAGRTGSGGESRASSHCGK